MKIRSYSFVYIVTGFVLLQAQQLLASPNDKVPSEVLRAARTHASKGEYQKALDLFRWYHEHAVSYNPDQYGVRLSFALRDWKSLGDAYPPAMCELIEVRDREEKKVRSEVLDRESFIDVVSINRVLGDEENTVRLFEFLDEENEKFAESVFDVAFESVVKSKNKKLIHKYFLDPKGELKKAVDERTLMMSGAGNSLFARKRKESSADRIFVSKVITIVNALLEIDENELARQIAMEASAHVDDPAISSLFP